MAVYDNLNDKQKRKLLTIARLAVKSHINGSRLFSAEKIDEKKLKEKRGVFVSLYKDGELRGCIGQMDAGNKELWQLTRDMAIAATEDPRFPALQKEELSELKHEISVLSPLKRIDDWQVIELDKHGVMIKYGHNCGVFLPQVARETGWSREEFLTNLCSKAGLPVDCYHDNNIEFFIFTAQVFND